MILQWMKQSSRRAARPASQAALAKTPPVNGHNLVEHVEQRKRIDEIGAVDKGMQILLKLKYRELLSRGTAFPSFDDVQFRSFSQNGEDGILLYIYSLIRTTNKQSIEICAGNGIECNTANLVVNHGWYGLMIDGNEKKIQIGQDFYSKCRDTRWWPPKLVHAWITAESINDLIRQNGFAGELDLFSLDVDGNDYWVWKALDCIDPRVVVLEYQGLWGPNHAVTQPYDPEFIWRPNATPLGICGASLPAFVKLGREKGYRLVGVHRCYNAVFMREGVGQDVFPEIDVASCFDHPKAQFGRQRRIDYERTASLVNEWVKV